MSDTIAEVERIERLVDAAMAAVREGTNGG